jgi:hypothetical protein
MAVTDDWIMSNYYVNSERNGLSILMHEHSDKWEEIKDALGEFKLYHNDIVSPGGGKSPITKRMERLFADTEWHPVEFQELNTMKFGKHIGKKNEIIHDTRTLSSQTHEIDLFKGKVAIEIEWNNKHQFFSRDLAAFDYLYSAKIIDVGIIITKDSRLRTLFESMGYLENGKKVSEKYGTTHTHTDKLELLLMANRYSCPLVVIGINQNVYVS